MEYRILGPLEVRDGDRSLPLAGAKQRALLALLLVNANHVLSRDRLIDSLWGEDPPETAVTSVQVYVSRLRKLLPPGTLVTRPPGYLLEVEPDELDLQRFEHLLADARKADPERASILLREALELWRGPALAEFAGEPFAVAEAGRIDDLRLAALEERIEADLALGRHADLIGELELLIAANPHRERLRGQLILALYRSGRQAEALEAYQQARRTLDQLGIEPSANLQRLEKAILLQDEELQAPARPSGGANLLMTDIVVGREIAGFRTERLIGRGGAGDVYLAYDLRLERHVALKFLPLSLAKDESFRERFVRESRILATLEHPNVVPVYDAGEADGRFYVAMRYIAEGSLRRRLQRGPVPPDEALAICGQVAAALDAAHARHVIHRDVKPENILVDGGGTAYVVDFLVPTRSREKGSERFVYGTPPYMAPEQARGRELDARADLYALACVIFECLAGLPPYGDLGMETLKAHVYEPVPKLSEQRPDLSHALDGVFTRALAKDPADRYESGKDLLDAVGDALGPRGRRAP
jgi:DNA-binding SARP family transcriptional activator